jgi:hypothetical protein
VSSRPAILITAERADRVLVPQTLLTLEILIRLKRLSDFLVETSALAEAAKRKTPARAPLLLTYGQPRIAAKTSEQR